MDDLSLHISESWQGIVMKTVKEFLDDNPPNDIAQTLKRQIGQLDLRIVDLTDAIRSLNLTLFDKEAPDYLKPSMMEIYNPDHEPRGRSIAELWEAIDHLKTIFIHMNTSKRRINDLLNEYELNLLSLKAIQDAVNGEWNWRILDFDETQNRVLAVTTNNIVFMHYHRYDDNGTYHETWENCSLRAWLNDDFYRILPAAVRSRVLEVTNKNINDWLGTNEGNDTCDKVFLLSADEAQKYFKNDLDRRSSDEWWLRTTGLYGPCHVDEDGAINGHGEKAVEDTMPWMWFGVPNIRPAMWINLDGFWDENENLNPMIQKTKVIGVGGAGTNIVYDLSTNCQNTGIYKGIDFIVMDTDELILKENLCTNKVLLKLEGFYEQSSDIDLGMFAVNQNMESILAALRNANLLILVAGVGGTTATSIAPQIATIAKEMGCLVISMAITPFDFEGEERIAKAEAGIERLVEVCDGVILFSNDHLFNVICEKLTDQRTRPLYSERIYNNVREVAGIISEANPLTKDVFNLSNSALQEELNLIMEIVNEPDNARALNAGEFSFDVIRQRLMGL